MLFPFTNSKVGISTFDIYCGQDLFSITARYPDWVNEMMGEALWREICLIVNKPKRNVKLKSVTGQVHCKRKKCCAYEPFTQVALCGFCYSKNAWLWLKLKVVFSGCRTVKSCKMCLVFTLQYISHYSTELVSTLGPVKLLKHCQPLESHCVQMGTRLREKESNLW